VARCVVNVVLVYVCACLCSSIQVVSSSHYQQKLESIGILIKARNFLVFQVLLVFV